MFFHEKSLKRVLFSFPVLLVMCMIIGFYYCYVISVLLTYTIEVIIIPAILFHATLLLLLWSYYMCIITDPGSIPSNFEEMATDLLNSNEYNQSDYKAAKITICGKCKLSRPPRAHHCSLCNRCILRMDHHCPWIGNCVGFKNHRFFIQFLVYSSLSCLNLGLSCVASLFYHNSISIVTSLIGSIVGLTFTLSVGGLAFFHIYLAATNKTTIEIDYVNKHNIFDTSELSKNCSQLFGQKPLGYFFPIRTKQDSDGIIYPVNIRSLNDEVFHFKDRLIV